MPVHRSYPKYELCARLMLWTEWKCYNGITEGRGINLKATDIFIAIAPDGNVITVNEVTWPKKWRGPHEMKACSIWLLEDRV